MSTAKSQLLIINAIPAAIARFDARAPGSGGMAAKVTARSSVPEKARGTH
jgi:hypothetical protein